MQSKEIINNISFVTFPTFLPETSPDDRKCADVPAANLVQVDRGKGTTLKIFIRIIASSLFHHHSILIMIRIINPGKFRFRHLQKRFSDSGRKISRAGCQCGVDVTKPTIVLILIISFDIGIFHSF